MAAAAHLAADTGATASLDGKVCTVSGVLDFNTASACLKTVGDFIAAEPVLTIDLSGVERSNSAGLALLVEWLSMARRAGHSVSFRGVPDGLRQLAGVCQVDRLI